MSSACPCDDLPEPRVQIAAGLTALPRQIRSFPEVRQRLLDGISGKDALTGWRAREGRDLGVMLLEMWAYVSDVLNFYDERIANETYLRTAARDPSLRKSLRRLVEGLGYRPAPGAAGRAALAAVAEGRTGLTVPAGTGFRSGAFDGQPPQVFELDQDTPIHPFKNEWVIGPQRQGGAVPGQTQVFISAGLGLAKDRLALFEVQAGAGVLREAHKVNAVASTPGKDGQTYAQVTFDSVVNLPAGVAPSAVRVRVPTVTAVLSRNHVSHFDSPIQPDHETLFLDAIYRQLRLGDPIIVARDAEGTFASRVLIDVAEDFVFLKPPASPPGPDDIRIPVSRVKLDQPVPRAAAANQLTFAFAFVDAGTFTTVADPVIPAGLLAALDGVPVNGIVERPPDVTSTGELKQDFLLLDADQQGVLAGGVMRFGSDGRARFSADAASDLPPTLKAPISVFGNLLLVSRGESVFNEVLGAGDGSQPNQQFKLRKKPLTYLIGQNPRDRKSTLSVRVDGVLWEEIANFFTAGPDDHVFIVRHDDNQDTFVTFGDGVSGARLPSGVDNVVATYRFGSGAPVPPAGSIEQIPRPFVGLRAVRDPAAASAGRDPETIDDLRSNAPKSALTFDRAVAVPDFQAVASLIAGVDRAAAEFIWFDEQQRAGVDVSYIGQARESDVEAVLRQDAEAGLPIRVRKATARVSTLSLSVAFDDRFKPDAVAAAVKAALTDAATGLLAPANAEIGGRLWSSRLYRAVQDVAGVVAVQSAVLVIDGQSIDLGGTDAVCTPAGTFLDFAGGQRVNVSATSPIGAVRQPKPTVVRP